MISSVVATFIIGTATTIKDTLLLSLLLTFHSEYTQTEKDHRIKKLRNRKAPWSDFIKIDN